MGADRPTMVLVHGIGSHAEVWQPATRDLVEEWDLHAITLPGFDGTRAQDRVRTVSELADVVEAWCVEAGLTRPRVVGHSLGGAIALELGRRGVAGSVVAFAPIGFWGPLGAAWCRRIVTTVHRAAPVTRLLMPFLAGSTLGRRLSLAVFYGRPADARRAEVLRDFVAFRRAEALLDVARAMETYRWEGPEPMVPTTVVWGTSDRLLPARTQVRRARRRLPGALHVRLDGAGHVPFRDDPVGCRLAMTGHLPHFTDKDS